MKLHVETYEMRRRFGDKRAIEMIAEAGFDGIDFSFYYGWEVPKADGMTYRDYALMLRNCLEDNHLVCHQAHAPFPSLEYGEAMDTSTKRYLDVVQSMECASILGARQIIVHSIALPYPAKEADVLSYNLAFFRSLLPYCAQFHINVAIENLFTRDPKRHCFRDRLGSPEALCRLIEELNSPYFVACIDVGHASLCGLEPEVFIRRMPKGIVQALHIQDTDYLEDRHMLPFLGDLNWPAIMGALHDIGYDGDLTFEIVKYLARFPDPLLPEALRFACRVGRYLTSL